VKRLARWSATARSCAIARRDPGRAKLDLVADVSRPSHGYRLREPERAKTCTSAARDAKSPPRDRVMVRIGRGPARPRKGRSSSDRARQPRVWAPAREGRSCSFNPPSGASARPSSSRPRTQAMREPAGRRRRIDRAARWPRQPIAAWSRCWGGADPGIEIEIALRKHELRSSSQRKPSARCEISDAPRRAILWVGKTCARSTSLRSTGRRLGFRHAYTAKRQAKGSARRRDRGRQPLVRDGDALDLVRAIAAIRFTFPRSSRCCRSNSPTACARSTRRRSPLHGCDMAIGAKGEISRYRFYPAVMRSRARLTYTSVLRPLPTEERSGAETERSPARLRLLNEVFGRCSGRGRSAARSISRRSKPSLSSTARALGRIEKVEPTMPTDHRRVHARRERLRSDILSSAASCSYPSRSPTPEKLESLREFLKDSPRARGGTSPLRSTTRSCSRLCASPDVQLLQTVLLRSLQQTYSRRTWATGLAYDITRTSLLPSAAIRTLSIANQAVHSVALQPGNWAAGTTLEPSAAGRATRESRLLNLLHADASRGVELGLGGDDFAFSSARRILLEDWCTSPSSAGLFPLRRHPSQLIGDRTGSSFACRQGDSQIVRGSRDEPESFRARGRICGQPGRSASLRRRAES